MELGGLELHSDEQLLAVQLKSAMSPPAAVVEKSYTMVFPAAGAMASRDSPEKGYAVYRLSYGHFSHGRRGRARPLKAVSACSMKNISKVIAPEFPGRARG